MDIITTETSTIAYCLYARKSSESDERESIYQAKFVLHNRALRIT